MPALCVWHNYYSAAIIPSVIIVCEIVTANVCLFHLDVAYLAPLPIVKLERERESCRIFSRESFTLDILRNDSNAVNVITAIISSYTIVQFFI